MPITEPGEFVTIENAGDNPYEYRYQHQRYTLTPHSRRIVPWGHFIYLMGNPFLTNADERNKDREKEYQRVHTLYGRHLSPDQFPHLIAWDADGERVYGVIDDRDGTNAPTKSAHDPMDPAALRAQLEQMARRQQQLEALIKQQERAGNQPSTPDDTAPPVSPRGPIADLSEPPEQVTVPEDTPTKTPVRSTRK